MSEFDLAVLEQVGGRDEDRNERDQSWGGMMDQKGDWGEGSWADWKSLVSHT